MMWRDRRGFTGLEAAIVLIAFVVVAAVFSYVMLGAGFFTTQKSQEVVHTGVKQASSSIELVGNFVAKGNTSSNTVTNVVFTIQLTSGGTPVDLAKTVITVVNQKTGNAVDYFHPSTGNSNTFSVRWFNVVTNDTYLEEFEKAEITIDVGSFNFGPNDKILVDVKPPVGASYPIERKVPPAIDSVMILY